ncbi:MAG: DUF1684 domain-containing protein [Candidatus Levybacteria bacterium]|nr:DUF1684 domain-containing protein [Candidatus Levybacteria bacterium]
MNNEKKLLKFRKEKDIAWKNDKESPLTEEQRRIFEGLNYFPSNRNLSFELLLNKNVPDAGKEVTIKTTGGEEQVYLRAGKVRFRVEGIDVEAIVFEDPEQEQFQYCLLFRDLTTGKETYKNGRMLQIPKKGDKLVVDFNYAYNPYSSYNDNWDCPITPEKNVLPVAIKAGEKKFNS